MKFQLRISTRAVRDIEEVLAHTLEHFGASQQEGYRSLIRDALRDISTDPVVFPAKHRPELRRGARTFHIGRRGRPARHFFLYRVSEQGFVEVARLLHDSMDLEQHLPEG